jgi:ectoine hydroxylase-related dioxygenase (phytanoyl-CoA dioxygenase family)
MTSQERYLFDLQGFLAVPNALDEAQLTELNAVMDLHITQECDPDMRTHRFGQLLGWGEAYRNLIDNPRIVPYLTELLGEHFRLDHDYADIIRAAKGPIGTTLHGGATPFNPGQFYNFASGRMYNGLTVVAYNLKDVNPGDGGFGCVPGSHKSNYPFPNEWRELENPQSFVECVTGAAGTAIIFTEALTHGTLYWRGQDERRTVFYKYNTHSISWAAAYYDVEDYEDLTERQRAILEPPNARYRGRQSHLMVVKRGE